MPERNHEVVIDGYVFPDTVTVTLANDEYIDSRDYVSKELYESVCGANDVWQAENAKLRELVRELYEIAQPEAPSMFEAEFADRMCSLGIEVDG